MNVLFIEDEEDLSASGVLQMETHGCKVTPAYDLAEARELLESGQQFKLVIADHRLPDGLGIQFVAEMKMPEPEPEPEDIPEPVVEVEPEPEEPEPKRKKFFGLF